MRKPSLAAFDRALAAAGALALKSAKLSPAQKRELRSLNAKAAKGGRQGLRHADRARMAWLIRKAAPDKLPTIEIPPGLRRRFGWHEPSADPPPAIRAPAAMDPLDRLAKLGTLRGRPLTEEQFEAQRARILADPEIGSYAADSASDHLDRLTKVVQLQAEGVLTVEQANDLTEKILHAG